MPMSSRLIVAALVFVPAIVFAQDCAVEHQAVVSVQSTPRSSLPGQSVRFEVFVAPASNSFDPGGTVSISDDVVDLGTFNLTMAQTAFTATFYSAGAHVIRVLYNGDTFYCSSAIAYGQNVDRITPSIAIASSAGTVQFGSPVSFTATVSPAAPKGVLGPAGPVQFFDSGTLIGTADLISGKAVFTTSALGGGTHQISATLIGDPNWYSVRTSPVTQTIAPASTTTLLNANATATDVTFSVSVNSAGVVPQTGTIQIMDATANTTLATIALPTVSTTLPIAKVPVGNTIAAVYTEGVSFASSTSNTMSLAALINAAGGTPPAIARDEIVSLFGAGFATSTLQATGTQQDTTLAGITINITDQSGTVRPAGLYLVSPTQINFVIPAVPLGPAKLTVTGANVIPMQLAVSSVAPGLFNPGAQILRVAADGKQTVETVTTAPIVIGPDPTFLVLYATGVRNRSSLAGVTASVGNLTLPVIYAGAQSQFAGLDQIDLLLPDSLKSAGKVNATLTVDGQVTNAIPLQFQ
jgi:uncharacterized protein (TIGR03437 family)